jgi:hypothetical protein
VSLETFKNIEKDIIHAVHRPFLLFFKGRATGTGFASRLRIKINQFLFPKTWNTLTFIDKYVMINRKETNYMVSIANSKFCLCVRGAAGWSFRIQDVIYGGCIPVLISDMTFFPLYDVLDYTKFSIFIEENEIDNVENILLSITNDQLDYFQTNLMRIRSAFVYEMKNFTIDLHSNVHNDVKKAAYFNLVSIAMTSNKVFS